MLTIPLQAIPNQVVTCNINSQISQIDVYQTEGGLFVDLYVNNVLIIGGVIAENLNRIVRSLYLGFIGDLAFQDTQGASDPMYTGLGGRYRLLYLFPEELT